MVDRVVRHLTEGILGSSPTVRRYTVTQMQALRRFSPEDVLLESRRDVLLKEIGRRSPPRSRKSAPSQRFPNQGHIEQSMTAAGTGGGDTPLVRQLTDARGRDAKLSGDRADPYELTLRLHHANLQSDCRFRARSTYKISGTSTLG